MPVDFEPDIEYGKSAPPVSAKFLLFLEANASRIVFGLGLFFAIYMVYAQAKRAMPEEDFNLPEPEGMSLDMMPAMTDVDQQNASFENMRNKLTDLIDEDPRKAANLIRRWMTKENYS